MKGASLIIFYLSAISATAPFPFAPDREKEVPRHLRFIALGELPPWKEKLVNGIRIGVPPPRWSVPPNSNLLVAEDQSVSFELNLRSFTEILTVPDAGPQWVVKPVQGEASADWFRCPGPTASLTLGVLSPDPVTKKWDNPKILLLDDDARSFEAGEIRFVNVSDKIVLVKLGAKHFGIGPERILVKPIGVGSHPVLLGYLDGQEQKLIWENQISVPEGQRVQCFFYNSGRPGVSRSVRSHIVTEPIPVLPEGRGD
jgi:hypothetical protein